MASLTAARRVVVKIGSALLVDRGSGRMRADWLAALADDVAMLKARGVDVILVSSGSIALGRGILNLPVGALPLEQSQAAAAVGQIRLAHAYADELARHDIVAAQVLVTLEDSGDRRRYLNTRATLETLLALGAVPIVNENDTIATDEIRYGDNDRLAAQVASMAGADVLILLSDVDGLYTANPRLDPSATRLDTVTEITPEIEAMGGEAGTEGAKGGMKTKLMAAKTAMQAGAAMAIMEGNQLRPLQALAGGANATWFLPQASPAAARKQWIASMKPRGVVSIDAGAVRALHAGKSLLPAGVCAVSGDFQRGDPVIVTGPDGDTLAKGLVSYSAHEAALIAGRQSGEIAGVLGHAGRTVLIHRDDLAI